MWGIPTPAGLKLLLHRAAKLQSAAGLSSAAATRGDPERQAGRQAGRHRAMGGCRASLGLLLLLPPLLWSCPSGTFSNAATGKCRPCTTCEGILEYKQKCLETADAICQCTPRYRCGSNGCEECTCARGEEMTDQGCQKCREGMFNDRAGGICRSWTKCSVGNKIFANGTRTTDVTCHLVSEGTTTASTVRVDISPAGKERDGQLLTISIALTAALLLCILSLLILSVAFRAWAQRKLLAVFVKQPLRQLAQEVDDCSCRYPEEEEGGGEGLKGELLEKYP